MSPWALNRFVNAVSRGAVFGYPTDTVWGFGCHPLIAGSVDRILRIKNRGPDKGLILLSSSLEYCLPYLQLAREQLAPVESECDHPTTWLVPASQKCPVWIRGNFPTVAIRITNHPLMEVICNGLEAPLVSTSANRSGKSTVRSSLQMRRQFRSELDFIISGFATGGNQASEIKSLLSGATLRSGS